jgi:hypothetical protein
MRSKRCVGDERKLEIGRLRHLFDTERFQVRNRITHSRGEKMSWLDSVDESVFLRQLFPNAVPPLAAVRLYEVQFHQDGPRVIFLFDLKAFPDNPPAKWRAAHSNTVQVRLMGIGITEMQMTGWAANNVGVFTIERAAEGVRVEFDSSECNLRAVFEYLRVDGVSAYRSV